MEHQVPVSSDEPDASAYLPSQCIADESLYCGIGRTTFVNTLCGKPVIGHKESDDASTAHVEEGVKIKPMTVGTSWPSFIPKELN